MVIIITVMIIVMITNTAMAIIMIMNDIHNYKQNDNNLNNGNIANETIFKLV